MGRGHSCCRGDERSIVFLIPGNLRQVYSISQNLYKILLAQISLPYIPRIPSNIDET